MQLPFSTDGPRIGPQKMDGVPSRAHCPPQMVLGMPAKFQDTKDWVPANQLPNWRVALTS